jgi:RNA polymerase sigma-70 factor (ECF subfamily)
MVQAEGADRDESDFLRLYVPSQHRIMSYLVTLVGDRDAASDLLQETAVTLWEKFDAFHDGTDFVAWACQIAFWKVKNYRRTLARSKIVFSEELLQYVSDRAVELGPVLELQQKALDTCLQRLDERDRAFLMARYEPEGNVDRAAQVAGRSKQAAYKALQRLRRALRDCVYLQVSANV